MKILAFAASNSSTSINRKLVEYAASLLSEHEVSFLNIHDYEMPLYQSDRETADGIPQAAHDFFAKIGEADAIIISFAEHNGSYTAAYKNLYDWTSRINMKVFQQKPMVLLATSPGGGGAKNVLATAASGIPHFGGEVVGTLSVPKFNDAFDTEQGKLTDPELDQALKDLLAKL